MNANPDKTLYMHQTCATDTNQVISIIQTWLSTISPGIFVPEFLFRNVCSGMFVPKCLTIDKETCFMFVILSKFRNLNKIGKIVAYTPLHLYSLLCLKMVNLFLSFFIPSICQYSRLSN
jgi:hypothetical protein